MPSGGYLLVPITYVAQRSPDDKVQIKFVNFQGRVPGDFMVFKWYFE